MLMFLTILAMSLLSFVLCAAAFGLATSQLERPQPQPERRPSPQPARFFSTAAHAPAVTQVPIELLLREVERHVRMEQAAAEAYIDLPSRDLLHSPTHSPLAN